MENFSFNPESKEKISVIYTAEFVKDVESLLKKFPPKHPKVFGHHSTIAFKPDDLDGVETGKETIMKIIGRAYDKKEMFCWSKIQNQKINILTSRSLVRKESVQFIQTNYLKKRY